jgi:hypothetical protein
MRYAFGVPAWLGAIKIGVVLLWFPGIATSISAVELERSTSLGSVARFGICTLVFILCCGVWWGILLMLVRVRRKQASVRQEPLPPEDIDCTSLSPDACTAEVPSLDERNAIDRALVFMRESGCRLYAPGEEVEENGYGVRLWGTKREGQFWVVAFLPAEPPDVVSSAHASFVYVDAASGEAEFLEGAVRRGWLGTQRSEVL